MPGPHANIKRIKFPRSKKTSQFQISEQKGSASPQEINKDKQQQVKERKVKEKLRIGEISPLYLKAGGGDRIQNNKNRWKYRIRNSKTVGTVEAARLEGETTGVLDTKGDSRT